MKDQKKILIIKFGGLGDVILSLNAIYSIQKHHKKERIVFLTETPFDSIFRKSTWFKEIVIIKKSLFYFIDKIQIKKKIKPCSFSRVYDLQTSNRSSSYLSIFKKKNIETCGIGKHAQICHKNKLRNEMHTIDRQKEQLEIAGLSYSFKPNLKWLFKSKKIIKKKPYALIVPGGSKKRLNKRIPFQIFFSLISLLLKKKILPVILGSKEDKEICNKIQSTFPNVKNLCGKTDISNIAKLSLDSKVSFGNDTGPMHIISLGGKPTFVFFTKNSQPKLCAPIGKKVKIFEYSNDKLKFFNKLESEINEVI